MVGRTQKSKSKNCTSRFVSYMVVHSVGSNYSISMDSRPVKRKENVARLMRRMLKSIERCRGQCYGWFLLIVVFIW